MARKLVSARGVKNRYPQIPANNDKSALKAQTANIETLTGMRGSGLDAAITWRAMEDLGYVKLRSAAGRLTNAQSNIDVVTTLADAPTKPLNVRANGTWSAVLITWDAPAYKGHLHTEVYRSDTDDYGTAKLAGTTISNVYADTVGNGGNGFYYWVRFVNVNLVQGPIHDTSGEYGQTAHDVEKLLETLTDKINESHLTQVLRDDITLITEEGGIIDSYPIIKSVLGETYDDYLANNTTLNDRFSNMDSVVSSVQNSIDTVANTLIDSSLMVDNFTEKLTQSLNGVNSRVDALITVNPDTGVIELDALNAYKTETEAALSEVGIRLDAVDTTISLKANKLYIDDYVTKLGQAGIDISGDTPVVSIHASKIETDSGDPLDAKLAQAGIDISGETGSISLSTNSVNVGGGYDGDETNLTAALNELYHAANAEIVIDGIEGIVTVSTMNSAFSVIAPVWDDSTNYNNGDEVIYNFKHWRADNAQTGLEPNTDRWTDLGSITGRFNTAESQISAADGKAQLALDSLSSKADASALATVKQTAEANTTDIEATTTTTEHQQSELYLLSNAAIDLAVKSDADFEEQLVSFARVTEDINTVAKENEALAERTQVLEVAVPDITARMSEYRVASIKDNEATVKIIDEAVVRIDNKTEASFSEVTQLISDGDSVLAGRATTLEGAVFEEDGVTVRAQALYEDIVTINVSRDEAIASQFSSVNSAIGNAQDSADAVSSALNTFELSFSDQNSAVATQIRDYTANYRGSSANMQTIAEAVSKDIDSTSWSFTKTVSHNIESSTYSTTITTPPDLNGDTDLFCEIRIVPNTTGVTINPGTLDDFTFTFDGNSSGEPEAVPDGNGGYIIKAKIADVSPITGSATLSIARRSTSKARITDIKLSVKEDSKAHALWAIKQNVGDVKSGIGLYNNGTNTECTVMADQFSIINATNNGTVLPFTVVTNSGDPDVPNGVYIDNAFINKAEIKTVVSQTVNADYVNAIDFHAINISGGTINIANAFTVGSNGGVIAKNITIMNDNNEVLLSSNANRIAYNMISGGPPQTADKTNYSDTRVNNNNVNYSDLNGTKPPTNAEANDYNYNNLFNKPSIPTSIADIDGDGVINKLENNIAMAGSEALAHQVYETYYSNITNSQGGVTGQYVGDTSYRYVDFYLPSAGMVSVFVRGASLGAGQRVEIRDMNTNSWNLMGTIPNLDSEYRTYSTDIYVNGSGNFQVRVGGHGASNNWYVLSSIKVVRIGDVDKTDYDHIQGLIHDSSFDPSSANVTDFNDWVSAWKARADTVMTSAYIANLFASNLYANKVWAGEIYAHKLSGDVYEAVAKRYTGTYNTNAGWQQIPLFNGSINPFAKNRVLEIGSVGFSLTAPHGVSFDINGTIRTRLMLFINGSFSRTTPFVAATVERSDFHEVSKSSGFLSIYGSDIKGEYVFEPLIYEHINSGNSYNYEVRLEMHVSGSWWDNPQINMFNATKVAVFMNNNDTLT